MSLPNQTIVALRSNGVAVARGAIVRASGNNNFAVTAQADTIANAAGIVGVANNASSGPFNVVTAGEADVLLEAGLTPVVGQTVYLSSTVAGRGAIAPSAVIVIIGTITDTSKYASFGTVSVALQLGDILFETGIVKTWASILQSYISRINVTLQSSAQTVNSIRKINDDTINLPVVAADPAAPVNGDVWIKDTGGVRTWNVRIAGMTYAAILV